MHEIITLQLGQRANYLATHFWNTQESYFTYRSDQESLVDHDRHFRPGIGADGADTFTPRTVIYDLKGGFGSLRKINALYELDEPIAQGGLWDGPTVIQREAAIQQNVYQQSLEEGLAPPKLTTESVKYWSDFNRVYYHPKSIVQLNEYDLGSTLMPFENWSIGDELFNSLDKEHDLLDRDLRPFAEEADHVQGIQLIASVDDAWGGFAARYLDRLRDEFGKNTVLFWGIEDGLKTRPREKRLLRLSNTARSISEITNQATLFIPMTLPSTPLPTYVALDLHSQWHISGLLSTALESMTLPSRLKSTRGTLDQLSSAVNINGNQNIAKLSMSISQRTALNDNPPPGTPEVQGQNGDMRVRSQERSAGSTIPDEHSLITFDMDFFPTETMEQTRGHLYGKRNRVFGQANTCRGKLNQEEEVNTEEDDGNERARRRAAGLPIIHKSQTPMPFPLLDSFPHIFVRDSTSESLSISTSLATDTSVALRIKSLQHVASRVIGIDEREALRNSLGEIAEAYEEGWDSGSDQQDD